MRRILLVTILALPLVLAACGGGIKGDPARGEALFKQTKLGPNDAPGCNTCHSLEPGEVKVGPPLAGVATHAAETLEDPDYNGQATTVEQYLRESIVNPDAFVSHGFAPGVMYQKFGEDLTEEEIADLVAFMMTLK